MADDATSIDRCRDMSCSHCCDTCCVCCCAVEAVEDLLSRTVARVTLPSFQRRTEFVDITEKYHYEYAVSVITAEVPH
jgi:hypothetical protein